MIRFGPSGIPLSCKGRTLRDGIEDVHNLGLTAMEVQLVRVNLNERFAADEDIGHTIREVPGELVVKIGRSTDDDQTTFFSDFTTTIERGDDLYHLASGVASDYLELVELGKIARELDIELTLHAPYYMDFADVDGLAQKSIDSAVWGGLLADSLQARLVVTHLGRYGDLDRTLALERVKGNLEIVRDRFKAAKLSPWIGAEASGLQEVVGGLDELLWLAKHVRGVVPVLNFAHLHAREGGLLRRPEDFQAVFDKVSKVTDGHYHAHFSGVEHEGGNEIRYTPIKKGDLRFEPLAECLLMGPVDLTLISSSPLLEHDAMYMRVILDRVVAKKIGKPEVPEPVLPPAPLMKPPAKPAPKKPPAVKPTKKPTAWPAAKKQKIKKAPKKRPARKRTKPKSRPKAKKKPARRRR
ncbi:MAG: TIM barrel protein [Methanobacteriota archaeon]|nr:MAG: TIM barrel protein [Euryarchaeota archaeon]